jgi:hypothetical protein
VTWETSNWAHGERLAAWLDGELRRRGIEPKQLGEARERQLRRWRSGSTAGFYAVDAWVTLLGLHPLDVPADVWGMGSRPGALRGQTASVRARRARTAA